MVIGNSAYKNVPKLLNPQNDSETIAASLRNIGFESVTLTNDATREKLIESLRTFANDAENADWAMVYYAGHGMEVNGANYLVPIDAKIAVNRDIEYEAVPLSQVLRSTDAAKKSNSLYSMHVATIHSLRVRPPHQNKLRVRQRLVARLAHVQQMDAALPKLK